MSYYVILVLLWDISVEPHFLICYARIVGDQKHTYKYLREILESLYHLWKQIQLQVILKIGISEMQLLYAYYLWD